MKMTSMWYAINHSDIEKSMKQVIFVGINILLWAAIAFIVCVAGGVMHIQLPAYRQAGILLLHFQCLISSAVPLSIPPVYAVGAMRMVPVPRYTFTKPSLEIADPMRLLVDFSTVKLRLADQAIAIFPSILTSSS